MSFTNAISIPKFEANERLSSFPRNRWRSVGRGIKIKNWDHIDWFNHIRWLSMKVKFTVPFGLWECGNHTIPCATHLPESDGPFCTQVFDNTSTSHQPWDPRGGPLAPSLSSILCVRSICCPILTKTKFPLTLPFFPSIMQFGKLFDHGMFLFLIKRFFKLIYKNILFKVSFTSTHKLEIIWHETLWKVGFQKCSFQHKFESTVFSYIIH